MASPHARGPDGDSERSRRIIDVVLDSLQHDGFDEIYVRKVAATAQVSLTTLYKLFGTREELIATALVHWMAATDRDVPIPPAPDETLRDGLLRLLGHIFERWERHPTMLVAYHRARIGPAGDRLVTQAHAAVERTAAGIFDGVEPCYRRDIEEVLTNLGYGLVGRFVDGEIAVTEILPTLERAVHRLTTDNESDAATVRDRRVPTSKNSA